MSLQCVTKGLEGCFLFAEVMIPLTKGKKVAALQCKQRSTYHEVKDSFDPPII